MKCSAFYLLNTKLRTIRKQLTPVKMKLQLLALIFCSVYIREGQSAGSCHYFSDAKKDWFDAMVECQKKKLCLANLDSKSAFDEIEQKLPKNFRQEYWFGLNGYEKMKFKYVSNDEALSYMPPEAKIELDKPCAFIKPLDEVSYTFGTSNCGRPRLFVCSAAVKCNGMETNSTFMPTVNTRLPCDIADDIKEILGIPLQ